jgi:hypothetical protein
MLGVIDTDSPLNLFPEQRITPQGIIFENELSLLNQQILEAPEYDSRFLEIM